MAMQIGMQSYLRFWFEQTHDSALQDADAVVSALRRERDDAVVHMKCFNEDEAKTIHQRLPDAYKGRVIFTWLVSEKPI